MGAASGRASDGPARAQNPNALDAVSKSASGMQRKILTQTTAADRGVVAVPVLTPHFDFRPMGDGRVMLVSETFNTLINGQIYCDLLPFLDGSHSREDITAALADRYLPRDVSAAFGALGARGYVVSGEHAMDRSRAAFWSSLGASPRWVEERLGGAKVAVEGDEGRLARRLEAMGVKASAPGAGDLSVFVSPDYIDARHEACNRSRLSSGAAWMLVCPHGLQSLFGPIFRPADGGPCWACLTHRLRLHREVHNFLRNMGGDQAAFLPYAAEPVVVDMIFAAAAVEIAKWLVLKDAAMLHDHAVSLDAGNLRFDDHPVMRRPQCFECGEEALRRSDRPAQPVMLQPSPKSVHNSGGVRSVSPEETLARYRHLVGPVSGVVAWIKRTTDEADSWLHVYWTGGNFAPKTRTLGSLRRDLRSGSTGKGSTAGQSEASALCEAVERYSGVFQGDEIRCRKRLSDFLAAGDAEAIHPNDVQLFSDRQLDSAAELEARDRQYSSIPPRFDPDRKVDWSPLWSFTESRHKYLPTTMLYYHMPEPGDGPSLPLFADSNGCAAGNTLEEAILQGFLELVERDSFAIWWYNRLALPEVDLESFGDDYLASARGHYRRHHRDMWVLDATSDLGIPAFVALSRRTDGGNEEIIYGAGAHLDPRIAALRAVCELNQALCFVLGPEFPATYSVGGPAQLDWWKHGRLADQPWLGPAPGSAPRGRADYPAPATEDLCDDLELCRALVEARGMEFLVLDQTRPDIGMPVARVVVPGLRHFWQRFAPGRLFDVPVEMGWRDTALAEADLNPVPIIA